MSHDFVDNLRMDRFRGVLLGKRPPTSPSLSF